MVHKRPLRRPSRPGPPPFPCLSGAPGVRRRRLRGVRVPVRERTPRPPPPERPAVAGGVPPDPRPRRPARSAEPAATAVAPTRLRGNPVREEWPPSRRPLPQSWLRAAMPLRPVLFTLPRPDTPAEVPGPRPSRGEEAALDGSGLLRAAHCEDVVRASATPRHLKLMSQELPLGGSVCQV